MVFKTRRMLRFLLIWDAVQIPVSLLLVFLLSKERGWELAWTLAWQVGVVLALQLPFVAMLWFRDRWALMKTQVGDSEPLPTLGEYLLPRLLVMVAISAGVIFLPPYPLSLAVKLGAAAMAVALLVFGLVIFKKTEPYVPQR